MMEPPGGIDLDAPFSDGEPVRTFPPTTEEPIVVGVREIVRYTGRTSSGLRATTGSMLRLLD
jgi:hypothetical protein